MAAVGGMERNEAALISNTLTVSLESDLNEICRKNGLKSSYQCDQFFLKPRSRKHLKFTKSLKCLNGSVKIRSKTPTAGKEHFKIKRKSSLILCNKMESTKRLLRSSLSDSKLTMSGEKHQHSR